MMYHNDDNKQPQSQRQRKKPNLNHIRIKCPMCNEDGIANTRTDTRPNAPSYYFVYHGQIKNKIGHGVKHYMKTPEQIEIVRTVVEQEHKGIRVRWIPTKAIGMRNTAQLCPRCKSLGTVYESHRNTNRDGFNKTFFSHYLGRIYYIDNATGKVITDIVKRRYCYAGRTKSLDALMDEEMENQQKQQQQQSKLQSQARQEQEQEQVVQR